MTDAISLLKQQQADNRQRYAQQQAQRKQTENLYHYIGYDADSGMAIVSNGSDTKTGSRTTNGLIKPNQPIKTLQAGTRMNIDSMPAPKPQAKPETTVRGKIKVLYAVEKDEKLSLWVGGWQAKPVKIADYPSDVTISNATINNLGGDRYVASWQLRQDGKIDLITVANGQTWRFSDTGEHNTAETPLTPDRYENLGFGFWIYRFSDPANSSIQTESVPYGSKTTSRFNNTGKVGYWLKTEFDSRPYRDQGSRFYENYLPPDRESYYSIGTYQNSFQEFIPFLPGKFAENTSSLNSYSRSSSNGTTDTYANQGTETTPLLINDRLTQAYAIRVVGSDYVRGVTDDSAVDRRYLLLGEAEQTPLRPLTSEGVRITRSLINWIGEKPYRTDLDSFSRTITVKDTNNRDVEVLENRVNPNGSVSIEQLEFQAGAISDNSPEPRKFKSKLYGLPNDLERSQILSATYHPY